MFLTLNHYFNLAANLLPSFLGKRLAASYNTVSRDTNLLDDIIKRLTRRFFTDTIKLKKIYKTIT
ncbi:MAG: hypothetical protein K2P98_04870 [Neisseriaceae bacterium]|nr:hypothetical protein [Neisseriaceae bacterium]